MPDNPITSTNVESPSFTLASPTFTATSTETVTPTLPATLTPLEANERIRSFLQKAEECLAPCFWGIVPETTTLDEAITIFDTIGLGLEQTNARNNQEFYATNYDREKELEIGIILGIQDNIVKTLDASITDTSEVGTPRKWSVYSPEALINQYGIPSKVEFFLGRVTPKPTHSMVLYFEDVELIVSYTGSDLLKSSPQLEICPITNRVEYIQIQVGKNQRHPPKQGIPLKEASSLSLQDFSKLMLGDPNKACFTLKDAAFP